MDHNQRRFAPAPVGLFSLPQGTFVAAAISVLFFSSSGRAAPEPEIETSWGSAPDLVDISPHELWLDDASTGSLWVSLQGTFLSRHDGRTDFGALALVGVPIERLFAGRTRLDGPSGLAEGAPSRRARSRYSPNNKVPNNKAEPRLPDPTPKQEQPPTPAETLKPAPIVPGKTEPPTEAPPLVLTLVSPAMARAAVAAALAEAHLTEPFARLDRIATRARASALLPELRLRATRQVDQSQDLSPTEYDPGRVTASSGASLWLEARATFRLDRLVFADEEVSLEKVRDERASSRQKLVDRVLDELFAWQRALSKRDDPTRDPDERAAAALEVIEAEAALDVLTGGWLSTWKTTAESVAR